jgi:hypothetical protein
MVETFVQSGIVNSFLTMRRPSLFSNICLVVIICLFSSVGFAEYLAKVENEEAVFADDTGQCYCRAQPPFATSHVETYRIVRNQVAFAVFLVCASAAVIVSEVSVFILLGSLYDFVKKDPVDG